MIVGVANVAGSLYQFCVGCKLRKDTKKTIFCPANFNPYNDELCPRNKLFLAMQKKARDGRMGKRKGR